MRLLHNVCYIRFCVVICFITEGSCSVCSAIAELFKDDYTCYKKYVTDIFPFCNEHFHDGLFDIMQLAIVAISMILFYISSATSKDYYTIRERFFIVGMIMTILTIVAAVIKIIVTFAVEEDKAKGGWEIGMFIGMLVLSCCCCAKDPCVPITLCLPILLMIAETIKNFITDDSTCLHPYQ